MTRDNHGCRRHRVTEKRRSIHPYFPPPKVPCSTTLPMHHEQTFLLHILFRENSHPPWETSPEHTSSGKMITLVSSTLFLLAMSRSTPRASPSLPLAINHRGDSGIKEKQHKTARGGSAAINAIQRQLKPKLSTAQATMPTKREPSAHVTWTSTRILIMWIRRDYVGNNILSERTTLRNRSHTATNPFTKGD